jgi:hypothetical protein
MHPADLENPADLERLAAPSALDGREWLRDPRVAIGDLIPSEAREMIEALYELGAFRIVVCDVHANGTQAIARSLIVQRTPGHESWQELFQFCARTCEQRGWWTNPNHSQALLLLRVHGNAHQFNVPLAPNGFEG